MAQTKVTKPGIADDAVETTTIKNLNVTNAKIAAGTIDVTAKITGVVPPANLGTGTASATTYLAGDGSYKTISEYDDNQVQSNIAMLGFKVATNGSLVRYNLVDQSIDEFNDTSGVDASASTNELRSDASPYYYYGGTDATPTNNADSSAADGADTVLKWTAATASGNLQFTSTTSVEYLIVAGGGGAGHGNGGGGGAGGYLANGSAALSLTGGNAYTVTVGAGGAGALTASAGDAGATGSNSILSGTGITTLTSGGGGGGAGSVERNGLTGGSGGGQHYLGSSSGAASGVGIGFAGGTQSGTSPQYGAGGGGGASEIGEAGTSSDGGDGGDGLANDITGASVYYAGGGGGSSNNSESAAGDGGNGGGGDGAANSPASGYPQSGTANTGGGGGAAQDASGGNGGSGIVVIRFPTAVTTEDLTLQSTDATASSAPTYGEFVTLIENAAGTATLNTDIKGYVSRDSGTTFTQGTLVDEGTWGTNKKILGFHDLDISSQPSGTSMCYKITTHNQEASVKETRVYATSIGWR